jgi:hypothetical protein
MRGREIVRYLRALVYFLWGNLRVLVYLVRKRESVSRGVMCSRLVA